MKTAPSHLAFRTWKSLTSPICNLLTSSSSYLPRHRQTFLPLTSTVHRLICRPVNPIFTRNPSRRGILRLLPRTGATLSEVLNPVSKQRGADRRVLTPADQQPLISPGRADKLRHRDRDRCSLVGHAGVFAASLDHCRGCVSEHLFVP